MTQENDTLLTRLAVRIEDSSTGAVIGSGVIYNSPTLRDAVYILTAAHCLYIGTEEEQFHQPRTEIAISLFSLEQNSYKRKVVTVNHNLVIPTDEKDVAVLVFNKSEIEESTGQLPTIKAIKERGSITSFALKGFPIATRGEEVVSTKPEYIQDLPEQRIFQLLLRDDFTTATSADPKVKGFSGSGVFLESHNELYLYGLFTRFRDPQKVIYCQYLQTVNEVLEANFLPIIHFGYIGEYGLTPEFFSKHNNIAIQNLGPRFSEKLNLKLPIVKTFHDISKDDFFKRRIVQSVDDWLLQHSYARYDKSKSLLTQAEDRLRKLKETIQQWLSAINWSADRTISLSELNSGLDILDDQLDEVRRELYDLQQQELQKQQKEDNKQKAILPDKEPFESELSWIREVKDANYKLLRSLGEISIDLANSPILIIKGEPGCGKSHLVGDIAFEANKRSTANLLFLGQLFKREQGIWQNIINQLGVTCAKDDLLRAFNSIGKQQGERLLIMIDALNEGPGKELWKEALAGFIDEVAQYPFIGLVLTIRTTYFNSIIPKQLQKDPRITYLHHQGFRGNEYAALKLFCEHYGLQTPNFPILAPEFSSPLFLQLICQGIKASDEKVFPQGFQGITKVFNYYVKAIYDKISDKREEYITSKNIVKEAIYLVAKTCFLKEDARVLKLDEADKLFQDKFPRHPLLLKDLIYENVFIQSNRTDYSSDEEYEVIYFSYERFGDFFIAEKLLEKYLLPEEIKIAFQKGNELGKLIGDEYWRNQGVLEAMSVRLPEKYNLEIVEVYDWILKEDESDFANNIQEFLSHYLWDSLKWRTPETINDEKITSWIRSDYFKLSRDEVYRGLIELTTVHCHPFNSDRLFKNLNRVSMPDRDSFWQQHMQYYSGYADDRNAYPIRRLIDWAWQNGISNFVDAETARLAGQTLTWVLSSTMRQLRDQTTKALVNLLEEQPDALITIMKVFANVDDAYISERLYAVAYGCALRTSKDESLYRIAQYIYDSTFKDGTPPLHILLRDYARNTIEYALYKGILPGVNVDLIRPPYHSAMPDALPTVEEVDQYDNHYNDSDPKEVARHKRLHGEIHHSTINWDFGRYKVDGAVRDFAAISFTTEQEFRLFKNTLKGSKKNTLNLVSSTINCISQLKKRKSFWKTRIDKPVEEWIAEWESNLDMFLERLKNSLTVDEWSLFQQKFLPHLKNKFEETKYPHNALDPAPIKRWIVKRAFELGYDVKKHGTYEEHINRYSNRHENDIERIGKKYQWIAFHEILARISDNYKTKDERWNSDDKFSFYKGPWQQYLRDIDPIYTTLNLPEDDEDTESSFRKPTHKGWWFDAAYDYWNQPTSEWINNTLDLPAPQNILHRKDEAGVEWVYLSLRCNWEQPKAIGQDKYHRSRKDIWYMFNSYLIPKRGKQRIVGWLNEQNFFGGWMPETRSTNLSLFNRENYWSPASNYDKRNHRVWERVEKGRFQVIVTTAEAVGEMSSDKSGAHARYDMPAKTLFEGMDLKYAPQDGCFLNQAGEVIVTNINSKGVLIRKKDLIQFLEQKGYDIVWTLLGEKNSITDDSDFHKNYFKAINGVYYFEGDSMIGKLSLSERD